jgi:hypothetical protein
MSWQEQLRAEGVRVSLVPPREISTKAQVYLQSHPELYREALERAQRLELFSKPKRKLKQILVTPDRAVTYQIAQKRALKRLNFSVQLLRFSGLAAY